MTTSVNQLFALYAMYILLPMVPSIIIYLIFPKTKISVSGPLQALSINATGAFAGYIICCLLGYPLINRTAALIENNNTSAVWKVKAEVQLLGTNGTELDYQTASQCIKNLEATINPPIIRKDDKYVTMLIPDELLKQDASINFSMSGFSNQVIQTDDTSLVHTNPELRTKNLGRIVLRQFSTKTYNEQGTLEGSSSLPD